MWVHWVILSSSSFCGYISSLGKPESYNHQFKFYLDFWSCLPTSGCRDVCLWLYFTLSAPAVAGVFAGTRATHYWWPEMTHELIPGRRTTLGLPLVWSVAAVTCNVINDTIFLSRGLKVVIPGLPVLPILSYDALKTNSPSSTRNFTKAHCSSLLTAWSMQLKWEVKTICKDRWGGKCSFYCFLCVLFLIEHFWSATSTANPVQPSCSQGLWNATQKWLIGRSCSWRWWMPCDKQKQACKLT